MVLNKTIPHLILICSLFFVVVLGLFEDEVGKNDWIRENIGRISDAEFYTTPNRKNIISFTDSNVLSSLNTKTGQIAWRKVMPDDDDPITSLTLKGDIIVTSSKKIVRIWDIEGSLVWEESIFGNLALTPLKDIDSDGIADIAIYSGTSSPFLKIFSGRDGRIIWQKDLTSKPVVVSLQENGDSIVAISHSSGTSQISIEIYDLESGNIQFNNVLSLKSNIKNILKTKEHHIILDEDGNLLLLSKDKYSKKEESLSSINIKENLNGGNIKLQLLSKYNNIIIVYTGEYSNPSSAVIVSISENGKEMQIVRKISGGRNTFAIFSEQEQPLLVSAFTSEKNLNLNILNYETKGTEAVSIELDQYHGEVLKIFASVINLREGSGFSTRYLVIFEDEYTLMIHDGKTSWNREESLANIKSIRFVDLPSISSNSFISSLTTIFGEHKGEAEVHEFQKNHTHEVAENLQRDRFGFRKLLIASSTSGKVTALHTEGGSIAWTKYIPGCSNILDTVAFRQAPHLIPQIAIICQESGKSGIKTIIHRVNAITGETQETHQVASSSEILSINLLPIQDANSDRIIMMIDGTLKIHLFPENEETKSLFNKHAKDIYFTSTNRSSSSISGFGIEADSSKLEFNQQPSWTLSFPQTEKIVASTVNANYFYEQIFSAVRLAGDRAVPKYINRNLLAIVTQKEASNPIDSELDVYLIDEVTGSVIYHTFHRSCGGPVSIVQSENWVVYNYWNAKTLKQEISVLELYDRNFDSQGKAFSSLESNLKPDVLQQTFVISVGVKSLFVTKTARGITNKQILAGIETDQILAINRQFLDPRRPPKSAGQNPEQLREEGIIPYDPVLPISQKFIINYYRRLYKLKGVETDATYLESTSLVASFGLDIFFTRVAPSGTFDILNADFNYPALIFTSVTLLILTFVSMSASKRADLSRLWR